MDHGRLVPRRKKRPSASAAAAQAAEDAAAAADDYCSDDEPLITAYVDWRLILAFALAFVGPLVICLLFLLFDERAPFWNDLRPLAGIFGLKLSGLSNSTATNAPSTPAPPT